MSDSWPSQTQVAAPAESSRAPSTAVLSTATRGVVLYWSDAGETPVASDLRQLGYSVLHLSAPTEQPDSLPNGLQQPTAYVLDLCDAGHSLSRGTDYADLVLRLAERLSQHNPPTQLIVFASPPSLLAGLAQAADQARADRALLGIFERPRTAVSLASYLRLASQRLVAAGPVQQDADDVGCLFFDSFGNGPQGQRLWTELLSAAASDGHVLVLGEPGTGKKLLARLLHQLSPRTRGPFARIDCREVSSPRVEQQLFGPSGSESGEPGGTWLERLADGTLVLAHVDCLTLPLQRRLRRYLQTCGRLAGRKPGGAPRILATSSEPLHERAAQRRFDSALLRLLAKKELLVPPLRQRREDVLPLAERFLRRWSLVAGEPAKQLTADARQLLLTYSWPENVRELFHVLENACSTEPGPTLTAASLQPWLNALTGSPGRGSSVADQTAAPWALSLEEMERRLIEATFTRCGGNRERTARALQIGVRTLSNKLREYGYPPHGGPGSNRRAA